MKQHIDPRLNAFLHPFADIPREQQKAHHLSDCALAIVPIADHVDRLFDAERSGIETMSNQRLLGYSSGRYCAHRVQELLEHKVQAIVRKQRMPVWPQTSVGSISHSHSVAVALASCAHLGVGIDLETMGRVGPKLYDKVFTATEISGLDNLPRSAPSIAFSAKEAGYKAIYPLAQTYIGFMEAEIRLRKFFGDNAGVFDINYVGTHIPNRRLNTGIGFWSIHGDHIMTVFLIPNS